MMDVVLGTAGHIDHGKTTLVRALTGINCDRLEEEQRRGITIELGFAWMDLPDGRRLGIVDVPGHERFVKAMVAGAAGIDCVLLIIAADEGVMPQTREHLDICSFLGVTSGLVVLTKTDMVDKDWLEMVQEDVKTTLNGTFLQDAPILNVSAVSGTGLESLKQAIYKMVAEIKSTAKTDIFRLPIDRVFTLKGHGTIVTGTVISGKCSQGEEVCVMPQGLTGKARSLQVHGKQFQTATQGVRCAINLQGMDVAEIQRGDVVAKPDSLFPSDRWIIKLNCLASVPHPLRQRMEVHFHHGAKECTARIVFKDRDELAKGESAIAEIRFSQPLTGVFGDHCVIRAYVPLRTIAGGILLDPNPPLLRKRDLFFQQKINTYYQLAEIAGTNKEKHAERLITDTLSLRTPPGTDEKHLAVYTGLQQTILIKALKNAENEGSVICWDTSGKNYIGKDVFELCLAKCLERVKELHKRDPLKTFFSTNALLTGWGEDLPAKFTQKVLEEAEKRGLLESSGSGVKLASHTVKHDAHQSAMINHLRELFAKGNFTPPFIKEIEEQIGQDTKKIRPLINYLCETGELVKIQDGIYYPKPVLQIILQRIRAWFSTHEGLDISDMKTIFDISRKYAIPLLEYMDASRITIRVGNKRQLNKNTTPY